MYPRNHRSAVQNPKGGGDCQQDLSAEDADFPPGTAHAANATSPPRTRSPRPARPTTVSIRAPVIGHRRFAGVIRRAGLAPLEAWLRLCDPRLTAGRHRRERFRHARRGRRGRRHHHASLIAHAATCAATGGDVARVASCCGSSRQGEAAGQQASGDATELARSPERRSMTGEPAARPAALPATSVDSDPTVRRAISLDLADRPPIAPHTHTHNDRGTKSGDGPLTPSLPSRRGCAVAAPCSELARLPSGLWPYLLPTWRFLL